MRKKKSIFDRLVAAAAKRGHEPADACYGIGCSLASWYHWKQGNEPSKVYRQLIEDYIRGKK